MFGGFYNLREFSMSPKMIKEQEAKRKIALEARIATAIPWDPKMPWNRVMTLTAASWPPWQLFDVKPTKHADINNEIDSRRYVVSPNGQFLFAMKTLPRGEPLTTMNGRKRGSVMFDADIHVPVLHERDASGTSWRREPWMSITPMEVMSQRPGTRMAKGHTVVAGLGLGWGLAEVMFKKSVERVTLVEHSRELVDWLLPKIVDHFATTQGHIDDSWSINSKNLEVIVGDARVVLATLEADVALVDIFQSYGGNRLHVRGPSVRNGQPPHIEKVWCWGGA